MKKIIISLLLVGSFAACSPIPQKARDEIGLNAVRCDSFIAKMDSGVTTREQEQAFIKANRKAWWATNFAINDAELPTDLKVGK